MIVKLIFLLILSIALFPNYAMAQQPEIWKYFEVDKLADRRKASERNYLNFLDEPSLSMGLYELKEGAVDPQQPHKLDEVYYIIKGRAALAIGEDTNKVQPGSVVYVKAEVPHRFHDITEDLRVLVIFSKTDPSADDPDWQAFELDELIKKRKVNENTWNSFLDVGTMNFGLYMLPKAIGGDQTLSHDEDEINIVVNGSGTFVAGEDEFEVKPGSIFFVEKNTGHFFKNLRDETLDVLILFQKK